jgi:hypothetical protein
MGSDQNFKCGNCRTIVKSKIFTLNNQDIRCKCPTCGPLCKECIETSFLLNKECKGCGNKKLVTENFRRGEWQ